MVIFLKNNFRSTTLCFLAIVTVSTQSVYGMNGDHDKEKEEQSSIILKFNETKKKERKPSKRLRFNKAEKSRLHNPELTVNILEELNKELYTPAMVILAHMYEEGEGVKKNLGKAFNLMLKADLLGDRDATVHLADMYTEGIFVKKDLLHAKRLYTRAANRGDSYATYRLNQLLILQRKTRQRKLR